MAKGRFNKKKNTKKKSKQKSEVLGVQIDVIMKYWSDYAALQQNDDLAVNFWHQTFIEQDQLKSFLDDKGFIDPIFLSILQGSVVFVNYLFKQLLENRPLVVIPRQVFDTSFLAHSKILKHQLDSTTKKDFLDYAEETHLSVFLFKTLSTDANFAQLDEEDRWLAMSLVRACAEVFEKAYQEFKIKNLLDSQ